MHTYKHTYQKKQARDAFLAELGMRHRKQCAGVSLAGPAADGNGFEGQVTLWYVKWWMLM